MNLMLELERLTQPAGASQGRKLTGQEIEVLLTGGEITPLEQIPHSHICGYESEARKYGKGRIGGRYGC